MLPAPLFLSLQDVQVPVCPLCNTPVPVRRGEMPDVVVGEHIDRDCKSDPAQRKRKVGTQRSPSLLPSSAGSLPEPGAGAGHTMQLGPARCRLYLRTLTAGRVGVRIRRAWWGEPGAKVVVERGWAATWDERMGNCVLPLGKCNQQLAAPACRERRLPQGAGPAETNPAAAGGLWAVPTLRQAGQGVPWAGVPGRGHLFGCAFRGLGA